MTVTRSARRMNTALVGDVDAALEKLRTDLIARRVALKWSRRELGERMGVVENHVYLLETGRSRDFTITTLIMWCRALDVSYVDVR